MLYEHWGPGQVSHGVTVVEQAQHHHWITGESTLYHLSVMSSTNCATMIIDQPNLCENWCSSDKQNNVPERHQCGHWHGDQNWGKHFLLPAIAIAPPLPPPRLPCQQRLGGLATNLWAPIIIANNSTPSPCCFLRGPKYDQRIETV